MATLTVLWQTKSTVSFPPEDKHVVNEHHVIRKGHDATQKKMSSRGAFQCTTWLVWTRILNIYWINSRHQKHYSEDGKKFRGCRGLLGRIILASFFFSSLWTSTSSRSINTQRKNLASIPPSWPHTWSITHTYRPNNTSSVSRVKN